MSSCRATNANLWKDSANLYYSTILDALAQARSELATSERERVAMFDESAEERCRIGDEELQRVTRERDEAQSALAELQGAHRDD